MESSGMTDTGRTIDTMEARLSWRNKTDRSPVPHLYHHSTITCILLHIILLLLL